MKGQDRTCLQTLQGQVSDSQEVSWASGLKLTECSETQIADTNTVTLPLSHLTVMRVPGQSESSGRASMCQPDTRQENMACFHLLQSLYTDN